MIGTISDFGMTNSLLLEDADLSSDILVLPASSEQDTLDFTISDLSAGNSRLGLKISKYFESLTPFNVESLTVLCGEPDWWGDLL